MLSKISKPIFSYTGKYRLLLIFYLLGVFILVIFPAGLSFFLAFFEFDALSPPVWVGKFNFILAYTDELFLLSVRNSVALIILPIPLRVFGAFIVARLMQQDYPWVNWFRASVFLPSIIPTTAYALASLWILNPLYGPVNIFLRFLGLDLPGWFTDPFWSKPALIAMSLWQIGEGFLISLVSLRDIPLTLEDAARIDGADTWKIFWLIILPIMAPILLLLSFRDIILTLQESLSTILLTTGGGPYYSTYTLPLFVYEQGFDLLSFGTASAAMWGLFLLSGLLILVLYSLLGGEGISITDETFF